MSSTSLGNSNNEFRYDIYSSLGSDPKYSFTILSSLTISPFLHKVSPITVDEPNMIFSCTINGRKVSTPLHYSASFKCKNNVPQSSPTLSLAELFKMERCIAYEEMHKESALSEISSKLEKHCTSESPNAFWTREKYFVLPFNPLETPKAQKASAALMSPSEREFYAN